jgi:hypothetical protein
MAHKLNAEMKNSLDILTKEEEEEKMKRKSSELDTRM